MSKIKIGDKVKFTVTTRQGIQTATRKVKSIEGNGVLTVGFRGYTDFYLKKGEYKKVNQPKP